MRTEELTASYRYWEYTGHKRWHFPLRLLKAYSLLPSETSFFKNHVKQHSVLGKTAANKSGPHVSGL